MAGRTWWCGDPPPSPTAMAGASSERQRERVASSWRQSCCLRLSKGAKVTVAAGPSCVVWCGGVAWVRFRWGVGGEKRGPG